MDIQHKKGREAEGVALQYLLAKGYTWLATNFRFKRSEVDLVMQDGDALVFVEVKTRNSQTFNSLSDLLPMSKQTALWQARDAWLDLHGPVAQFRVDVVLVLWGTQEEICHYSDVLDATDNF